MDDTATPSSSSTHTPWDPNVGPDPVTEQFAVSVNGGGGVDLFRAALTRKFRALMERGCHCVILERTEVACHYVQAIVTPVGVRIEAVGDQYLQMEGFELTGEQAATLRAAGWHGPPDLNDGDDGFAQNWWQELGGDGFVDAVVDQLLTALIGVYGLRGAEPLTVRIFPADCQLFEWIPDPERPGCGSLEAWE